MVNGELKDRLYAVAPGKKALIIINGNGEFAVVGTEAYVTELIDRHEKGRLYHIPGWMVPCSSSMYSGDIV